VVVLHLGRWDKVSQCIIEQVKQLVNITHGIILGRILVVVWDDDEEMGSEYKVLVWKMGNLALDVRIILKLKG
jgi:hypothetical protein